MADVVMALLPNLTQLPAAEPPSITWQLHVLLAVSAAYAAAAELDSLKVRA